MTLLDIMSLGTIKEALMSDSGKPPRASQPGDAERFDSGLSDEAEEGIERMNANSGHTAGPCDASPPPQGGEASGGRRSRIHLSDRDRFLAILNSDEGPNEALRQAAEAFRRTSG